MDGIVECPQDFIEPYSYLFRMRGTQPSKKHISQLCGQLMQENDKLLNNKQLMLGSGDASGTILC